MREGWSKSERELNVRVRVRGRTSVPGVRGCREVERQRLSELEQLLERLHARASVRVLTELESERASQRMSALELVCEPTSLQPLRIGYAQVSCVSLPLPPPFSGIGYAHAQPQPVRAGMIEIAVGINIFVLYCPGCWQNIFFCSKIALAEINSALHSAAHTKQSYCPLRLNAV